MLYLDQTVGEEPVHLSDDGRQPAPVILLILHGLNKGNKIRLKHLHSVTIEFIALVTRSGWNKYLGYIRILLKPKNCPTLKGTVYMYFVQSRYRIWKNL